MGLKVCQTLDWRREASCALLAAHVAPLPASLVQFPALCHRLNMISLLSTLLLVMVIVTQEVRGQEQPLGVEDEPVMCEEDRDCLSPGDMCCFDLSNLTLSSASQATKKCCSDEKEGVPIIWPQNRNNLTEAEMKQLDKTVSLLAPLFMDSLVCDGLDYKTMLRLNNCQDFTTTTTERPNKLSQTDSSTSLRGFLGMVLLGAIITS